MKENNKNILIINPIIDSKEYAGLMWRTSANIYPLGILCLVETFSDNTNAISVDLEKVINNKEQLVISTYDFILIKEIKGIGFSLLSHFVDYLKQLKPQIIIGLVGDCNQNIQKFDFVYYGTGYTIVSNLLKGIVPKGYVDYANEDCRHELNFPYEFGYLPQFSFMSNVEKKIGTKSIEINQPWAGFLDNTPNAGIVKISPMWINSFLKTLDKLGFTGIHFNVSVLDNNLMQKLCNYCDDIIDFSISCSSYDGSIDIIKLKNNRLKRVWFFYSSKIHSLVSKIHSSNIEVGLEIQNLKDIQKKDVEIISRVDRIIFSGLHDIELVKFKKIILKFWIYKNRFIKRLFKLKSISDLVDFSRLAYTLLEVLIIKK